MAISLGKLYKYDEFHGMFEILNHAGQSIFEICALEQLSIKVILCLRSSLLVCYCISVGCTLCCKVAIAGIEWFALIAHS